MKPYRPDISIIPSNTDKVIDVVATLLLVLLWLYTIYNYTALPAVIPTHFNFVGNVDRYGSKQVLLILPIVATFIILLMHTIGKYPNMHNYITTLTPQNVVIHYTNSTKLLRYIKLGVVILLGYITYIVIQASKGCNAKLGGMFFIVLFCTIFLPTIITIILSYKKDK